MLETNLETRPELPEEQKELLIALDHVILRRSEWVVRREDRVSFGDNSDDRDNRNDARPRRRRMVTLGL